MSRVSMDPETASIRSMSSAAPSYVSQLPPNYAPPPYSSDGRLPPYTRPPSGRPSGPGPVRSAEPSGLRALSSASYPLSPLSNLPPVSLITPGVRNPQSRHYEAVAARRHAKIVSSAFEAPDPPRRRNRRRPGVPFENFSSLHPAPSTPLALVHSTAELFLCTCGRPNHRRTTAEDWLDPGYPKQSAAPQDHSHEEPSSVPQPSQEQNSASDPVACAKSESEPSATEDTEQQNPKGQGDQRSFEEDLLDAESKSWDFMLSQMAN
ncbi:hypothetical protein TWF696_005255 [Orbilia brochopaga]|uniref:Uncharacterized protein n=1 Tax=Orbilia brochopaga TaxID=3140254 RepID=A0AAV9V149_9PEZI